MCIRDSHGGRKPAQNASPAPVPSTILSTGSAATRTGSGRPLLYHNAPSALILITTCGNHAVSTLAADSASSRPVSTFAWSMLANSSLAPLVHSRNGSAPVRSSGADEAQSTEIDMPLCLAMSSADRPASREPSLISV